ncbi:MAG: zinc-binding dehydrogenase, partial [archaeon]|nr:zinc-binding dehydrogenase [archaeon]
NHLDIFVTKGWSGLNLKMPHILGSDGSGIIKEIGNNVSTIEAGDHITINPGISCGKCSLCLSGNQNFCKKFSIKGEHFSGTFAEYFIIPESNIFKLNPEFPFNKAAAAPLAYLTAWRMLVTKGKVKQGDFVFIQGGSGGVSICAIQIAKLLGAKVITSTSSEEKVKILQKMGADHVINYNTTPNYSKFVYKELTRSKGIDIVIDSVGKATFENSIKLLRPGGKFITCGATTGPFTNLNLSSVFWKQLEILGSTMSNQSEFQEVMELVVNGKLDVLIDREFILEQAQKAEEYLNEGTHIGKIILKI